MWSNFDGKPYSRAQFAKMVAAIPAERLKWVTALCLHNTACPTIAQWLSTVASPGQRIINLEAYYEHTLGWHAGPHGFIPPSKDVCIYGFTNLDSTGVHASCFNGSALGFEMVGDFATEEFNSGPGALVRDNAIFVLAVMYRKLGLRPDGVNGLLFHKDCKRDNHDCPGKNVNRPALVAAIVAEMDRQGTPPHLVIPAADPPWPMAMADEAPPEIKYAADASASATVSLASATSSAIAINELADQGSRIALTLKKCKAWLWRAKATVVTGGGGVATLMATNSPPDPNTEPAGDVIRMAISSHPILVLVGLAVLLAALVGLYVVVKRIEKWLLTAYRDGRYQPRQQD